VNLWPYSFINEKGEPDGYNIDLLKILITKEFVKIVAIFFYYLDVSPAVGSLACYKEIGQTFCIFIGIM